MLKIKYNKESDLFLSVAFLLEFYEVCSLHLQIR